MNSHLMNTHRHQHAVAGEAWGWRMVSAQYCLPAGCPIQDFCDSKPGKRDSCPKLPCFPEPSDSCIGPDLRRSFWRNC